MNSAAAAARGTQVTSTATCPVGKVAYGGGGRVTTTDTADRGLLSQSYPSAAGTWTAVGVVSTATLLSGRTISVTAYVLCGIP